MFTHDKFSYRNIFISHLIYLFAETWTIPAENTYNVGWYIQLNEQTVFTAGYNAKTGDINDKSFYFVFVFMGKSKVKNDA